MKTEEKEHLKYILFEQAKVLIPIFLLALYVLITI